MFLKLICFGSKIYIVSIEIRFKAIHHLQRHENLHLLLPPLILCLFTGYRFDKPFRKSFAVFQNVNVLKYLGYKCLSFPKLCGIPSAHALRNILKIVTFAIEKIKLASFSLFLDAFSP